MDGGHRYLRKALKARGWVEKFTNRTKRFQTGDEGDDPVDFTDDPIDDAEKSEVKDPNEMAPGSGVDEMDRLVSRALRDHEPDFQWIPTHRVGQGFINSQFLTHKYYSPKSHICVHLKATNITLSPTSL